MQPPATPTQQQTSSLDFHPNHYWTNSIASWRSFQATNPLQFCAETHLPMLTDPQDQHTSGRCRLGGIFRAMEPLTSALDKVFKIGCRAGSKQCERIEHAASAFAEDTL